MPFQNKELIRLDEKDQWLLETKEHWYIDRYGYVHSRRTQNKLHQYVIGRSIKKGYEIDHINGNKLDNRRSNLRIVTRAQNMHNTPKRSHSKQKYKGIQILPSGRFRARIKSGEHIGVFETPEEAFEAYKKATVLLYNL